MITSIIGFPRVGSLRELKFATEKYFRHEISQEDLQVVAKGIREKQWKFCNGSWISGRSRRCSCSGNEKMV